MAAKIIDGRKVAEKKQQELAEKVQERLANDQRPPGLAVVLVGSDPASMLYVNKKRQTCEKIGFLSEAYDLPRETSESNLLNLISELNDSPHIDGILVQLPLPDHIDTNKVLDAIHPDKDVDGFHPYNVGRLAQKRPLLRSCTPYGIITMLEYYKLPLAGLDATVVGASNIVGKPMTLELLLAGCTPTTCHSRTKNLKAHVERADLLIVALGRHKLVQAEWIKPGAIVIDVGTNRLESGKVVGDLDFEEAKKRASWITPVPGGVGPMTVTTLLHNTFLAAEKLHTNNAQTPII